MREFKAHAAIISQCKRLKALIEAELRKRQPESTILSQQDGVARGSVASAAAGSAEPKALPPRTGAPLTIDITGVHPEVFRQILMFLYGSESIRISRHLLVDLLTAAKQFELLSLYDRCLSVLDDHIDSSNVLYVLNKSHSASPQVDLQ